jgi:hypothetical protein
MDIAPTRLFVPLQWLWINSRTKMCTLATATVTTSLTDELLAPIRFFGDVGKD